ncbi:hypothetical protein [Nostoc sp. JL31]|uniref:hypothetical protein n=1 Tax=Nostoc sp. JL31 TaxID=2815395 RepID=UPI0025D2AE6C|nr:hypothetical protein [Nostoc sp. JL31]
MERAFFEAGKALAELGDRRLYRSSHRTFEEYCRDRISRVYSSALEESVQKFLEMLGKLNRAYLTDLEEKVLSVLEFEI